MLLNDDAGLHMEEFQNALEGKITTEGWSAEKLVDYHKFLKEATDKVKGEVGGLREAKRVESDRVEKLKSEALLVEEQIKKAKVLEGDPPANPQMAQFRSEQVEKAKNKLYSTVKLTDEEKTQVEEKFKRLDTGKLDSEFIYQDYVAAVAAVNAPKYLELTSEKDRNEAEAKAELERQAASGEAPPADPDKDGKKYSDEAYALAKKAGITPEEANRQLSSGMTRTYD